MCGYRFGACDRGPHRGDPHRLHTEQRWPERCLGDQLFRSVGYKQPWDGKYRDGYVPVGTYYYVIELNDERFSEPYTGPLTVIR